MLKSVLKVSLTGLILLIVVLVVRTLSFTPEALSVSSQSPQIVIDDIEPVVQHLSEAIQFKTISKENIKAIDTQAFENFISWLGDTYPEIASGLDRDVLNQYTLLYRWAGQDKSKSAILLSAHYDVVPVVPGTEKNWHQPPFDGVVEGDTIWGRGALDDKSAVIGLMEAVTHLIKKGFQPQRNIYIALTHDEEIGSRKGAKAIVELLESRNVTLDWSLDEGSFILNGFVDGVENNIASINLAEKGYLTLELTAHSEGGHSSMPPQDTAVSILAEAIIKLRDNPVPGGLSGLTEQMYSNLAQHMDFSTRLLFANSWLFKPLLETILAQSTTGNAMLRTTTAPTMLNGSIKANVLPITATAKVNFRLHPRDTVDSVTGFVRHVINDERITIVVDTAAEPSSVASKEGGFEEIAAVVNQIEQQTIVSAGITIAATDSRYYSKVTDAYRFNPMVITKQDLAGFHGTNEKISTANMKKAVEFYANLMARQ